MTCNKELIEHFNIKADGNIVGSIRLWTYDGYNIPHIEYEIEEEYMNLGIMTQSVRQFLDFCKTQGILKIAALVKQDNIPSQKVLEKNFFCKHPELIEDNFLYFVHLGLLNTEGYKNIINQYNNEGQNDI